MDVFKLKIGNDFFDISSNETILKCAYKNGVKLKYHCASGYILTCCSYPKSNIEI